MKTLKFKNGKSKTIDDVEEQNRDIVREEYFLLFGEVI